MEKAGDEKGGLISILWGQTQQAPRICSLAYRQQGSCALAPALPACTGWGGTHINPVGVALQQVLKQLLGLVEVAQVVLRHRGRGADPVAVRELCRQILPQMPAVITGIKCSLKDFNLMPLVQSLRASELQQAHAMTRRSTCMSGVLHCRCSMAAARLAANGLKPTDSHRTLPYSQRGRFLACCGKHAGRVMPAILLPQATYFSQAVVQWRQVPKLGAQQTGPSCMTGQRGGGWTAHR